MTTEIHASAARLLGREVSADSLQEATAHVAAKKNVIEPGTKSIIVFRIGAEWLALPTGLLVEVADRCTVRRLPHHRVGILNGLVSVRGELLLCIALGAVLGLENAGEMQLTRNASSLERLMICKRNNARLAFQVSEVYGLHRYHPRELRNAPATLAKAPGGIYTLGVLPWRDRIVGCLDDELLFYTLNRGLT